MRRLAIGAACVLVACGNPVPSARPTTTATPAPPAFAGRETDVVKRALPGVDRETLERADRLEFLAVQPYPGVLPGEPPIEPGDDFHGYRILGRAHLTDPGERRALIEAVYRGFNGLLEPAAACFNPRHGLRARRGEQTVEILLCYECSTARIFSAAHESGAEAAALAKVGEDVLDGLLKAHGLPKAPR
jgi:hypothetical protein